MFYVLYHIYVKKFQEEGLRFYDLPLNPKKVLMIRKTCCGYKDWQSLCFKFYLDVLMIYRKSCCRHNNRQGIYFMFYVLYHIHKAILKEGFMFYDLPLYPKKVLMIRKACYQYNNWQSLCFMFYFAVCFSYALCFTIVSKEDSVDGAKLETYRVYVLCFTL